MLSEALDLVLPPRCAGCAELAAPLCAGCRQLLAGLARDPASQVHPWPPPPGWPGCTAALTYEGLAARLVTEYKDGGRRDLAAVLAVPLAHALRVARDGLGDPAGVVVVAVPSSPAARRARGDRPVADLVARAAAALDPPAPVRSPLRVGRRVADQAGLGAAARRANLHGALGPTRRGPAVAGRPCLVVDDVVTSGATLAEARRALLALGASEVALAALAATPRRIGPPPGAGQG